jgi:putative ABC transport system substrate-binding protein
MNRRDFVSGFAALGALITAWGPAIAQQPGPTRRIGILRTDTVFDTWIETFRKTLDALGYVEGKNVTYDYQLASTTNLPQAAGDLLRAKVDLIVAAGTPAALAAKQASGTVPIVFMSADPVHAGLVASIAHPGANVTGIGTLAPELGVKRLELLRQLLPHAKRLAVLVNLDNPVNVVQRRLLDSAAKDLGFQLQDCNIRRRDDLDEALSTLKRSHVDGFVMVVDAVLMGAQPRIAQQSLRTKVPGIFPFRTGVEAGGLLSYGPDITALWRQAAEIANKILRGANPADLPIEQPTKFELVVNVKTAKALGITIPESILLRADEVIR